MGFNQVKKAARVLDGEVKIISLEPESVEDILENILLVGQVTGYSGQVEKAVDKLKKRLKIYDLRFTSSPKICLVDGDSYMTRPGPAIVDGIEILAEILHPDIFPRKHSDKDWRVYHL